MSVQMADKALQVKAILHPALVFKNEANLHNNGSMVINDIGNVTR